MTELTRSFTDDTNNRIVRWVVSGPAGAVSLDAAMGQFAGLFAHSRTNRFNDGPGQQCPILGADCWSDAFVNTLGREVFDLWKRSDDAVYERLEELYRKEWPEQTGRCGESVPQANYDTPKAGA